MGKRVRFLAFLSVTASAAAFASSAGATPLRPLLAAGPFPPLAGASVPCLNGGIPCYLPFELQAAYNFPAGPGAPTGAGQTIVVVTAYGAPFIRDDIATFGALTGVPFAPSLTVYKQQTPVPGAEGSGRTYAWQVESDLDAEWAYAMAPRAHVGVAVASSDDPRDLR